MTGKEQRDKRAERASLDSLQKKIGYRFRSGDLLTQALTHSSFRGAQPEAEIEDNERLEFLGDAVLGYLVSETVYRLGPGLSEGKLSRVRSNLVNATNLSRVADELKLGRCLRLGPGEEKTGGRKKPALLADAVEALVAALFLDGGAKTARRFVERFILADVPDGDWDSLAQTDYKTSLQEWMQARRDRLPQYKMVGATGPDHRKTFLVELWVGKRRLATGRGGTKKAAEQAAAAEALKILQREGERVRG